jgi:CHAT domain
MQYLAELTSIIQDFSLTSHATAMHALATMPPAHIAHDFAPQLPYIYCDPLTGKIEKLRAPLPLFPMDSLLNIAEIKRYEGKFATRQALWKAMEFPTIVQLTRHGIVLETDSEMEPYVILTGKNGNAVLFHVSALYGIPNFQNRIFILNACHTAMGRYLPGEGPISFARSFRQVGCPTVICNRWDASVQVNAVLLGTYYARIAAGDHSAPANCTAKRAAINSDAEAMMRHPEYWGLMSEYGEQVGLFGRYQFGLKKRTNPSSDMARRLILTPKEPYLPTRSRNQISIPS